MRDILVCGLVAMMTVACGGKSSSPTSPSAPSTPATSAAIVLEGDLEFGDVRVGASATKTIRIVNRGSGMLQVTGITWPASGSVFTADWTNGSIAVNQWRDVAVTFTPGTTQSYGGTMTVQGNQTSGTNTMAVVARGVRELFVRSGVGNTVFDLPSGITRLRIQGTPSSSCQNFIVYVGGRLTVNDILGTCSVADARTYDGTHVVSGTVVEIKSSTGVSWTFTEVR